jgi:polysaccharide biosynthesis/export protein
VLEVDVRPFLRPIAAALLASATLAAAACSSHARPDIAERGVSPNQMGRTDDYLIGAGDSLSVFVYHNPDLSEPSVAVRPDGRISVPLIEDIAAAGKTPSQLAREIEVKLRKFLQDPNVTIIVRSFVGPPDRQVRVIGEASEPQAIPYRERMTLLDVMIATKGLTKYAAGNRAVIIRNMGGDKQVSIPVRLNDLIKDGDITENIPMKPGDTLIIPQSWF